MPAIVTVEIATSGGAGTVTTPATIGGGVAGTIVATGAGFSSTAVGA